jgi:hypothetical protein
MAMKKETNMNMKKMMILMLLAVAIPGWAIGEGLALARPEFKIGHDNAKSMTPMLSMMADELELDLNKRADLRMKSTDDSSAARLTCVIQDVKASTTVFQGSTYKAWNTRVAVPVQLRLQPTAGKMQERSFTIVKRLRSTSGEPRLDDTFYRSMAREIVNQCYEELVGIIRTLN